MASNFRTQTSTVTQLFTTLILITAVASISAGDNQQQLMPCDIVYHTPLMTVESPQGLVTTVSYGNNGPLGWLKVTRLGSDYTGQCCNAFQPDYIMVLRPAVAEAYFDILKNRHHEQTLAARAGYVGVDQHTVRSCGE